MSSCRTQVRQNRYKVAGDAEDGRRRRDDSVEIRKNNREENLLRKRQLVPSSQPLSPVQTSNQYLCSLASMAFDLYSDDSNIQLQATTQFRKLLAIGSPVIEEVKRQEVVPLFVEFSTREDFPLLQTKPALPVLERLVHSNDEEVLANTCLALLYLSDGTNDRIQALIEAGICKGLVELLQHPSLSVLILALRTVGNIVMGGDAQTQCIIEHGALPRLLNLLTHEHEKDIKKEACWTISIINSGNKQQIQAVIEAGLIAPLVNLIQKAEFDIKKAAAWAITKAISVGTNEQIMYLVSQGCIKPLCDLLLYPDPRIKTICLEGLENILKVGEVKKNLGRSGGRNYYAQLVDDAEGLEKIEILQNHDNNEIYDKAVKILDTYWFEEEDEAVEDAAAQPEFNIRGSNIQLPSRGFNFNNSEFLRARELCLAVVKASPVRSGQVKWIVSILVV